MLSRVTKQRSNKKTQKSKKNKRTRKKTKKRTKKMIKKMKGGIYEGRPTRQSPLEARDAARDAARDSAKNAAKKKVKELKELKSGRRSPSQLATRNSAGQMLEAKNSDRKFDESIAVHSKEWITEAERADIMAELRGDSNTVRGKDINVGLEPHPGVQHWQPHYPNDKSPEQSRVVPMSPEQTTVARMVASGGI